MQTSLSALFAGLLAVLSAHAHSAPSSPGRGGSQPADFVGAEVKGTLTKAAGAEGASNHRIQAAGMNFEVDTSAAKSLTQVADRLDGKVVIVRGNYAERKTDSGVKRMLIPESIVPGSRNGRAEYVDVVVRGTLTAGIIAIGAETTGTTITSGAATWELELPRSRLQRAAELSGRKVIVSGQLRRESGVEVRNRWIVKVRSLVPAMR
jgi:hypothetical protein